MLIKNTPILLSCLVATVFTASSAALAEQHIGPIPAAPPGPYQSLSMAPVVPVPMPVVPMPMGTPPVTPPAERPRWASDQQLPYWMQQPGAPAQPPQSQGEVQTYANSDSRLNGRAGVNAGGGFGFGGNAYGNSYGYGNNNGYAQPGYGWGGPVNGAYPGYPGYGAQQPFQGQAYQGQPTYQQAQPWPPMPWGGQPFFPMWGYQGYPYANQGVVQPYGYPGQVQR